VTKRDRLRRVVLLCAHFSRNLAYYRAGHDRLTNASPSFWITIDANFLDMAVMEWCKLLGDQKGKHFWAKVVTDSSRFKAELLSHLGSSPGELAGYINEMRAYRDQFLAHLDDLPEMEIPFLDRARAAVNFYHRYVVQHEAKPGDLVDLPLDLADYYNHCFAEATTIYGRCGS
jgi:hypothetical protein